MYLMMRAIGEMLYQDPEQHTFTNFITRYLWKGLGLFLGLVLLVISGLTVWLRLQQSLTMFSLVSSWPSWLIQVVF